MDDKKSSMDTQKKHNHGGHRARVKQKLVNAGERSFSIFPAHELLEALLFYSIPQHDVNDLAHDLIEEFGSLSGVMDAPYDRLMAVKGIKENTATHILLIRNIMRASALERNGDDFFFDERDKLKGYVINLFSGEVVEKTYALFFDNARRLISYDLIGEGVVNSAPLELRKVVDLAAFKNASAILIAHNHPNGTLMPSSSDHNVTDQFVSFCSMYGVNFLGHYIVAGDKAVDILGKRTSKIHATITEDN